MMKFVVLSCLVAVASASASAGFLAPYSYSPLVYSAPLYSPYNYNYRGPLSLAPGQPANILGADGRPLDTLEVNLDRSAHYISKAANSGFHILKKRSAPLIAPVVASRLAFAHTPLITPAVPIARVAPFAHYKYAAPIQSAPFFSYW